MELKNTKLETELNRVSSQYKVMVEKAGNQKDLDERNKLFACKVWLVITLFRDQRARE